MSKRYCLLPQGFSEACAADCEHRHHHLSSREADDLLAAGEIELHDVHPIRKTARYIERVHDTQKVDISANVIRAAAGAYKTHRGESRWARRKVSEYGRENREFSRLSNPPPDNSRSVILPGVCWTDEGLACNFAPPIGGKVSIIFHHPPSPQTRKAVADYWKFFQRDASDPFVRTDDNGLVAYRRMAKAELRRELDALSNLDAAWPEIVIRIFAGPFSLELMQTKPSEWPSILLMKTLREYLK